MMRPVITADDHQRGVDWLIERQQSMSSLISITDLQAHLPGLDGMTHDEVLALVGATSRRSSGGMILYHVDDVLSWWRYWRPAATEAPR